MFWLLPSTIQRKATAAGLEPTSISRTSDGTGKEKRARQDEQNEDNESSGIAQASHGDMSLTRTIPSELPVPRVRAHLEMRGIACHHTVMRKHMAHRPEMTWLFAPAADTVSQSDEEAKDDGIDCLTKVSTCTLSS
jgi:hypothetical protein